MLTLMTAITVRPARSGDLPALAALWLEKMVLLAQADARLGLLADAETQWQQQAERWLNDARCALLVALEEQQIAGFIVGWVQALPPGVQPAQIGVITELALEMHRYQQGIARALVEALRQWFREQGISAHTVLLPQRQALEQAFWRAQGAAEWMNLLWIK